MKKLLIPAGALLLSNLVFGQTSTTENYVQTKTYLDYNGTTPTKSSETVQYFDGLGRPKQIVNVKASPLGKDVVIPIEYDPFGRQVKDYFPVPQGSTLNGAITPNPLSNLSSSPYGNEKIYSEKVLENSPLNRILEQKQVGNDWNGKSVKFGYDTNGFNEVYQYITTTSWIDGATKSSLSLSSATVYAPNQLYKNSVKDENDNETIEFKNGKGQVVLVRKIKSSSEHIDTYYVYNEYDQLAFVIPPMAVHKPITDEILNTLCYQYRYDGKGRLVEKKVPGKGWEFMVYDKADRLMLSQDTNMKGSGKWLMTKYDQFGRVAYTGIFSSDDSRATIQGQIKDLVIYDARHSTGFVRNGMNIYYTAVYFTPESILSVNYYDSYPAYSFNPAFPSAIQGEPTLPDSPTSDGRSTKGMPVMSFVKNIEDDSWTKNYTYYDTKGRAIGSHSINHLGGYTHTESKLDFAGVTKLAITRHKRLNTDTERVITETFEYDHQNRLLVHKHQVDSNPIEILAQNTYNEISQVTHKKVGGKTIANPLQSVNFTYNIRGWMTGINDPDNLGSHLFGYKIKYQNPVSTIISAPQYNGNIAEVDWKTSGDGVLRRYSYTYDKLSRLVSGIYQEPLSTVPVSNYFNENVMYDLNGNILSLKRNERIYGTATAGLMDDLKYTYKGNQLIKVEDLSQNKKGYPHFITPHPITYDSNGNMSSHLDKGISAIQYNYMNLPVLITQNTGNTHYSYRTDGTKIKKKYGTKETDYLDGFQYENNVLQIHATSEGYFDFVKNAYIYNYLDHLGNVRLSYFFNNSSNGLTTLAEDNYYPFGLKHTGYNNLVLNSNYKYKYNGKELQETGMYDYGARFYMPDIGRWGVVDPLAETSRRWSTYNYAYNNPISFIDPDGREGLGWGLKDNMWQYVEGMQEGDATYQANGFTSFLPDGSIRPNVQITNSNEGNTGLTYLGFNGNVSYIPTEGSNGSVAMLGLATMFSDAFSKIESAISGLIGSTNEEFPQITNTGGLARTDFDATTHDKLRPGDKVFTLDWGSFVAPSTLPANGFINRNAPTWGGRFYASILGGDRIRELSDLFGKKKDDSININATLFYPSPHDTIKRVLEKNMSNERNKLQKTVDSINNVEYRKGWHYKTYGW